MLRKKNKENIMFYSLMITLVIIILFYEEMILFPLRKIIIPGVGWVVKKSPPWAIISIFSILEIGKLLAKPLIFVAFGFGFIPGIATIMIYIAVSFFSLQIMVHGSEKLRSYAWFNSLYEWIGRTFSPYKKKIKKWWKEVWIIRVWKIMKWKNKKNKNSFFTRLIREARKNIERFWRHKKTD